MEWNGVMSFWNRVPFWTSFFLESFFLEWYEIFHGSLWDGSLWNRSLWNRSLWNLVDCFFWDGFLWMLEWFHSVSLEWFPLVSCGLFPLDAGMVPWCPFGCWNVKGVRQGCSWPLHVGMVTGWIHYGTNNLEWCRPGYHAGERTISCYGDTRSDLGKRSFS